MTAVAAVGAVDAVAAVGAVGAVDAEYYHCGFISHYDEFQSDAQGRPRRSGVLSRRSFCWLGVVPLGIAGTVLSGLTPAMTPGFAAGPKTVRAEAALLSGGELDPSGGVALMIGGSGVPIPPENLVQTAFDNYVVPHGLGAYTPQGLNTPEALYPVMGVKELPYDTSLAQGVTILNNAIKSELDAGNNVLVGGVSQSSTIASLEMRDIVNGSLGFRPTPEQLGFGLLGDPSNPNGGLMSRFDLPEGTHPSLPSLGFTFSGGTPADTGYETDIYTSEYDGFADFPRYPINALADLNAIAGMDIVHPLYIRGYLGPGVGLTPEQIAEAKVLPTSDGYDGNTTYYMMPYDGQLPLAQLIQTIAGKPLADLLEPDLRVLVNLGYGPDPSIGWSEAPANVETPLGLFPSIDAEQWHTILQDLAGGTVTGFKDFIADLSNSSTWAPAASTGPSALSEAVEHLLTDPPSLTQTVNAFTAALSHAYATLLPTADILNTLLMTMPAYDVNVFTNELQSGNLLDAVGLPIAADTGFVLIGGFFEVGAIDHAVTSIQQDFSIF